MLARVARIIIGTDQARIARRLGRLVAKNFSVDTVRAQRAGLQVSGVEKLRTEPDYFDNSGTADQATCESCP